MKILYRPQLEKFTNEVAKLNNNNKNEAKTILEVKIFKGEGA